MQDGKQDWPHGNNQLGQRLAEDGGEEGPHPERFPLLGLMRTEGTQDELEGFRRQEAKLQAQKGTPMQIDADAQTAAAKAKAGAAGSSGVTNGKGKEQPSGAKAIIPSEQRQRKRGQGNKGQKIDPNNKNGADLRIPHDERVPIPAAAAGLPTHHLDARFRGGEAEAALTGGVHLTTVIVRRGGSARTAVHRPGAVIGHRCAETDRRRDGSVHHHAPGRGHRRGVLPRGLLLLFSTSREWRSPSSAASRTAGR
jgi:hypothetical protein